MKITMIHGQNHIGSTCRIGRILAKKLGGELREFFLPGDFGEFCVGCTGCFMKGEEHCPHYHKLLPITEAMDEADVLILTSPVYVYHATGPMKTFLDHYGYRWMIHRPEEKMFRKQAVCISTAAGAGMKSTNQDMADSLFFWGVPKVYRYGRAVHAVSYEKIAGQLKRRIDREMTALAEKIRRRSGKVRPGVKTRGLFFAMHLAQRKGFNGPDREYWAAKGWTGRKRPW